MEQTKTNRKLAVILIGPPGSGKGTYGKTLVEAMGGVYLSTGEALRERRKKDQEFDQRVQSYMDDGELVPDGIILDSVRAYLHSVVDAPMVLLDGAVRTLYQATSIVAILRTEGYDPITTLQLELSREDCRKRLLNRKEGRTDDQPEKIDIRLNEYFELLPGIENYLRHATEFVAVSTLGTVEEVRERVREALRAVPVA